MLLVCRYRSVADACSPTRRLFALVAVIAIALVPTASIAQEVPELQITSKYYIVIDAETGEVFAQRGADEQVAIASLTKIFTAIESIEAAAPDTVMTTEESDVFDASSTTMGLTAGETFTFQDLLYGMLLPSGNDAAYAIARNLGYQPGDTADQAVDRFMAQTNQRIRNMGLKNTNLVNPHGWGVPGHFSTAADIAAFTMYALRYPRFVEAISTPEYTASDGLYVTNTNKMLNSYDGIIGGKTGYDDDAGYCLVEVAERDGSTMISVTLDGVAPDDWYDDNRVLLDYAFEQKAKRSAAKQPFTGRVLSFRDPDAAVIEQNVRGGASLLPLPGEGLPGGTTGLTAGPSLVEGADTNTLAVQAGETRSPSQKATDVQVMAAVGVAVMVILARGFGAFTQPGASETRGETARRRSVRVA